MLLQATFTDSHKTDSRDNEEKVFESLLEKQNRENKEPTSQFYGNTYNQQFRLYDDNTPLIQDSTGYLYQNLNDTSYPSPNILLKNFNFYTLNIQSLEFNSISSVILLLEINFFCLSSPATFASDFNFDIWLVFQHNIAEQLLLYEPLLKIKLGTVTYSTATNQFSYISKILKFNLSDTDNSLDFVAERTKLSNEQYKRLVEGKLLISYIAGFDTSTLSAAQKAYMYNRQFINKSYANLLYKGISKL
jgi:hypothetical protein